MTATNQTQAKTSGVPDVLEAEKLFQKGRFLEALEIHIATMARNPKDVRAWIGVGMVMVRTLQWEQAAETFTFVLRELEPGNPIALHGLSVAMHHLGEWQAACELADMSCAHAPHDWRLDLWRVVVHANMATDPARTLELFRQWGGKFADPLTAQAPPLPALSEQRRNPDRRLKVGYVSGDLRQHSVAFFMEPVFAHHNPAEVEVFVYSTGERDSFTERMAAHVPHWFDVFELTDEALCDLIRRHEIDVLVDLSGNTWGHRLLALARRAAPVQVTWIGCANTLGMRAMDYRLTDWTVSPPGSEIYNSETLFRLDAVASYAPPLSAPLSLEPPMLMHGHPTLISLNNSKKVTNEMLQLWRDILERQPDAHLVVMTQEINQEKAVKQMQPRLEKLGFPLDRVIISKQLPLDDFMTLGGLADIALDTFPISGGTTTLHSLWMGLPIVTLEGHNESSQVSATMLRGLGYDDWIVSDKQAYVDKVAGLMQDVEGLREHRRTVRARLQASHWMAYSVRTAELERAFKLMWINHLLGERRYLDSRHDVQNAIESIPDGAHKG